MQYSPAERSWITWNTVARGERAGLRRPASMDVGHRSLPPSRREKKRPAEGPLAALAGDAPEWLDVIPCGQLGAVRDVLKAAAAAAEDKSAVPSCYESCDSTSLSSFDNGSEGGAGSGKEARSKDAFAGRYSFKSRADDHTDGGCQITRLCMNRDASVRSTGFVPRVADAGDDEPPEILVTADTSRCSDDENGSRCAVGRGSPYASLPRDFLRVPRSRKGRLVLSGPKKAGRKKGAEVFEVRRVPSDSADSGIYTSFGKEIRSYGLPQEDAAEAPAGRNMPSPESQVAESSLATVVAPATVAAEAPSDESAADSAQVEMERRRRQRNTELATIFIFIPVLIAWILIVPLVLFSYSFENPYSKHFEVALWICIPLSTLVLSATCLVSNVYWYYDGEAGRWRYRIHCGKGPANFYWGDVLTDPGNGKQQQLGSVQVV
ncbi:uncharacterized protein [Dermacentor albipictus]|uniref:uncharacterized protein isoform X4 n=1 Tax=Dermacentor albipictus TaxID=60249 RepID=UPI0038FC291F